MNKNQNYSLSGLNSISAYVVAISCFMFTCCKVVHPPDPDINTARSWVVDKSATHQTVALFYNLKKMSETNILFGHQDDTKNGYGWTYDQSSSISIAKSDVKDVTGAYPAVYGWDFKDIANFDSGEWFDYEKQLLHNLTVDAYNRGGVNTYSWHYANPVSKGPAHWKDSPVEAVSKILPGGSHHNVYKQSLKKKVADYAQSLVGGDGKLIPIIFRPFHEMDGDWFWWGKTHCSANEYKELYKFTVTYLRDSLGVHNFLYAWSPDRNFSTLDQYLERYPGDDYVDIVGTDNYWDLIPGSSPSLAGNKLKIVSDYAIKNNKVAAFTETGLENLTQPDWYTQMLQKVIQNQKMQLAYVLVWSNSKDMYWTPYKGHPAENDFIHFKNNQYIIFGDKIPLMYEIK